MQLREPRPGVEPGFFAFRRAFWELDARDLLHVADGRGDVVIEEVDVGAVLLRSRLFEREDQPLVDSPAPSAGRERERDEHCGRAPHRRAPYSRDSRNATKRSMVTTSRRCAAVCPGGNGPGTSRPLGRDRKRTGAPEGAARSRTTAAAAAPAIAPALHRRRARRRFRSTSERAPRTMRRAVTSPR